jgi:hypothetical protein
MNMNIGSGDIPSLLMGLQTKGYADLWRKFLDENPPYYNSFASPIDALRTGAILERNYLDILDSDYFFQIKRTYPEMDVFTCSIDFGKFAGGKLVDFDELKTIWLTDYLEVIQSIKDLNGQSQTDAIKKKFKNNYNQVQDQLMCAELDSANLVFMSVESYDDDVNARRLINPEDVTKFRINRDETVIQQIKERGQIFQQVKDNFNGR